MAWLFSLLLLTLPVGLLALVVWLQQRRERAWRALANQLGLSFSDGTIIGTLHGQHVCVATESRGSGDSRRSYTVVSASLATPLDLGLRIVRDGWLGGLFARGHDIVLGHPEFDATFRVSGDEDERVRYGVSPALQHLLLQQLRRGPTFTMDDRGMRMERAGVMMDERWLRWALEVVARGTLQLDKARAHIPVAGTLAHHRLAWQQYAQAHGLKLSTAPLCVWGQLGDTEVHVYTVRTGVRDYQVDISMRFRDVLRLGLHVGPQGVFDRISVFFGSQDQRFGDPLFDKTFRVRSANTERSERILTPAIRKQLLQLHGQLGPITVNDAGISVRLPYVPHEPAMVPRVVNALLTLSDAVEEAANTEVAAGPYR